MLPQNCGVTDSHDLATGSEVDIDIFLLKKRPRRRTLVIVDWTAADLYTLKRPMSPKNSWKKKGGVCHC